jgi:5S rRNA maturation endonuclease (ribonuclease M5)
VADRQAGGVEDSYRLPELLAAPTAVVYFCEGEKDADNVASKACVVATSASEGASAKWVPELTQYFKERRVVILPDADEPGRKHAQKVAKAIHEVAASVKVVDLHPDRSDGHDVTDWLKHDAVGARLFEAVKAATEWEPGDDKPIAAATPEDEALLIELAALSRLDYAKRRKRAAVKLGISVSDLDRFVAPLRDEKKFDKTVMLYAHWQVEPWDEAVDGKILFRALYECVRRYVILTEPQATAVTLWVVYSWLHEHERFATHSPVLLVRSAEKDSGKTTLLGIVTFLTRRALNSVEISGAALFRSIAKWQPTFVIDEGDDVLTDNADLRSVLNSGWTRGQTVVRCHHDTHEPESFSTFAPKVLGMKGNKLPDTTLSRSLAIDMKPKLAGEWIADFDHLDNETFARLRRQVLRWATDNAEELAARQPEIPQDFHNRRRANWRPLLAIAEAMDVKQAGWEAALEIERRQITVDPSTGIQLLQAVRFIFDEMKANHLVAGQVDKDRITTARLAQELIDIPDSRWGTYGRNDKPITAAQVTRLLKPYGIKSESVRIPKEAETTHKGYLRAWFEDAFTRYLPPLTEAENPSDFSETRNPASEPGTPGTTLKTKDFSPKSNPEQVSSVPGSKLTQPAENIACSGCSGFEGVFSGAGKTDRTDSAADAPADIPTDRTCVQCHGEIDGTEQLVAVSGKAVWLHPECERFWLAALDEGRCPERGPADPAASSRSFRIKGPAPPDSVCVCCYRDEAEAVLKIASTEAGSKSETLHEKCAAQWFAALRDFENGPSDDDNSWQGQA